MKCTITLDNTNYEVNTDFPYSAAIELNFNGEQPNHYGAEQAQKTPMTAGSFIGNTEQGGSCNVNLLNFNPHCNGTHTESIAHICDQSAALSLPIGTITPPPLMPCVLVSVMPEHGISSQEDYSPALTDNDMLITRAQLEPSLNTYSNAQLQSLAIRTLPNASTKKTEIYNDDNQPAFFSREAILLLNERGVEHLLVDLPSIDRLHDDGLLTCHHLFWQVIEEQHQPTTNSLINKTITELAYFDDIISDGFYFINLQLTALINDATPSKPVLYAAEPLQE
ncbi:cyclase family protein [Thalassotalea atypica]|uniref:cyclase family protein n=1 Tax=Thalassotalea atypica TaxID=2054316 RepID=UPI002573B24E|nr:cyclase family protein [Thalassotalea atypica]